MSHAKTLSRRWIKRLGLVAAAMLVSTSAAHTRPTPEQECQSKRAIAAGKYAQCAQKVLANLRVVEDYPAYSTALGACVTKYAATWDKLQAKASGSGATCDNSRFVDNGDGAVTDRLTGLQWEKKTNLDSILNYADQHDADNIYSWSASGTAADGLAFTDFLKTLNSGGCFAGECDWRLPTLDELLTIVSPAYPACTAPPCIDPVFGPTVAYYYWSATTPAEVPDFANVGSFNNDRVGNGLRGTEFYVRAVRSGS